MAKLANYLWIIILALYILSPLDAHPLFLDDLIASGILFYYLHKNLKKKPSQGFRYAHGNEQRKTGGSDTAMNLDKAYDTLGIDRNSSWEEVKTAYKDKIKKSHPDKVTHLSRELQDKAKELTLRLNHAFDTIKRFKNP